MAEPLTQLCCLIVEDLYGSLLSQVFHEVARRGRLTATQIAQACHLPLRQVKTGVAALVQLRLLYHHTSSEAVSTYQANLRVAYDLVRIGKIANLANLCHGRISAVILEELALLGFASHTELKNQVVERLRANGDNLQIESDEVFIEVLGRLVRDKFVFKLRRAHLQTRFDARKYVESYLRSHGHTVSAKGKKAQTEFDDVINSELEKGMDPSISDTELCISPLVNGVHSNRVAAESDWETNDQLYLCVDYSKIVKSIRNTLVCEKLEPIFGKKSVKVLVAALAQVNLDSDPFGALPMRSSSKQTISITQMQKEMSKVPKSTTGYESFTMNGWHDKNVKTNGNHHTETVETEGLEDEDLRIQLSVIAEGPLSFLVHDDVSGQWFVDQSRLKEEVQEQELARLMGERVGGLGIRLIRMMKEKGKLDEKSLQELGLLGAKDLRQTLARLQTLGFIELQEIPREPQRQPNRTIFLWFYDAVRVRDVLLGDLYKSMARVYQRLQLERERLSSTLDKIERTDVQGSEEEILGSAELLMLRQWRRKESWLLVQIDRLDDSVALLRDL